MAAEKTAAAARRAVVLSQKRDARLARQVEQFLRKEICYQRRKERASDKRDYSSGRLSCKW